MSNAKKDVKILPKVSIETSLVVMMLGATKPGDIVDYLQLSEATPDPQGKGRGKIQAARHILLREKQMVFSAIPNIGYRRLTDTEILELPESDRRKIGRIARIGVKKISAVQDYGALTPEDKFKFNMSATIYGVLDLVTKKKTQKRLESRIKDAASAVPALDAIRELEN